MVLILLFLFFGVNVCDESRNVFPYLSDLEDLLNLEISLLSKLEQYTESLESQIAYSEKTLHHINEIHSEDSNEENHPFAFYRLITRFTEDWLQIEEKSKESFTLLTDNDRIPSNKEYLETLFVLAKLQKEYQLSTSDLVNGKIAEIQTNASFSWQESLSFGYELYRAGLNNQSQPWFREGMRGFFEEGLTDMNLMDSIRKIADHIGDDDLSKLLKNQILKQNANFNFIAVKNKVSATDFSPYGEVIEDKLCRGENLTVFNNLTCTFIHYNNPYLIIGPHKLEVLHEEPFIGMIHSVLSDVEIRDIEYNSRGKLQRSMVLGPTNEVFQYHKGRTSTSGHLNDKKLLDKLIFRMANMTNLEVARFPDDYLTITNYGIGSFYKTHHDIFFTDIDEKKGNRIATVMFYLSEVDVGGSTVFPDLHLNVKPRKGSALVWFNLKRSGAHNLQMRHAACSLVKGEKLIATYWISERGNEFKKPCGLNEGDLISL
ncbi:hypothetical protein ACFFRR_007369 [Megaselia abdita]